MNKVEMEVDRIKKVIGLILFFGILGTGYNLLFSGHEGFNITIENRTGVELSGLYVTYLGNTSSIEITSIAPLEKYKFNVTPTEDFSENSMTLHYKDHQGELHTEYVVGYFEKGGSGSSEITVKSIDESGKMEIVVEEKFN